jgi:hypothetical protein
MNAFEEVVDQYKCPSCKEAIDSAPRRDRKVEAIVCALWSAQGGDQLPSASDYFDESFDNVLHAYF